MEKGKSKIFFQTTNREKKKQRCKLTTLRSNITCIGNRKDGLVDFKLVDK